LSLPIRPAAVAAAALTSQDINGRAVPGGL